jgi:hypothetical protein
VTRRTPTPLPGLKTGTVLTLTMAGLTVIAQLGQQSLGVR